MATAGVGVAGAKIPAVDQWDLHGVEPAGRDAQKVGEHLAGRRAVDRRWSRRRSRRSSAATRPARPSRRRARRADVRPPGPRRPAAAACGVTVSRFRIRSAEKPVGWWDSRSKVATNRPATKCTTKQKATCTAISACIRRRRECGSSPPLSALTGLTEEARSAGRQAEQERHAEGQRQAESENAPVRRESQARRIVRRIDHADDERRGPPGEERADGGGQQRQPGAFHQDQLHQAPASRADGDAQRHLARARRGLRGHQVGHVGAGDQQHQRDQDAESQQRTAIVALHVGAPAPAGSSSSFSLKIAFARSAWACR